MIVAFFFIVMVLALFYLYLVLRDKRQLKKLLEDYDVTKNPSRKTGFSRGYYLAKSTSTESAADRPPQLEGRELLSATGFDDIGEDSDSRRKAGKSSRGIFRKFRRK